MRIWCCLPCFEKFDSELDTMDEGKNDVDDNDNEGLNLGENGENGGEKESKSSGDVDLGFYLGLRGVNSGGDKDGSSGGSSSGGSKRDLEGEVVEKEKSLFEALELSIGGSGSSGGGCSGSGSSSSSRVLPRMDVGGLGRSNVESTFAEYGLKVGIFDCDNQNKRAKVDSSSQDCLHVTEELACDDESSFGLIRSHRDSKDSSVHESNNIQHLPSSVEDLVNTVGRIDDHDNMEDDNETSDVGRTEVNMDLLEDLLHMVFSFLGHKDLCSAAVVCKQWRAASAHEDFWRSLDFENRKISVEQLENVCHRYPRATEVNLCGNPDMHMLVMRAVSLLRNLEALTIGKGQLGEAFFVALSDCSLLRKLFVCDAGLGNGVQEVMINHDTLQHLQVTKCRVLRVSVRCPQLKTLSLKRSNMAHVVLNCPLLHNLDIGSCHKLPDSVIRSAVISCPRLENLDMSNCSCVTDETLREIASACPNLRELNASYCPNISLESVKMPLLTVLRLESCDGISSASMTSIVYSDMLEVLELDNCNLMTSVSLELPHLKNLRLVHCRKFVDLNLRCFMLSSLTVSNCPALHSISITSNALKKLALHKQESLNFLSLQCQFLEEVDLADCEALTNSVCDVFSDGGGCPLLKSLVLDNCESLTTVELRSTSLVCLSLAGCQAITTLDLACPYLVQVRLHGCDHLERASFVPVGLQSLNLGICPKLGSLLIRAPQMTGLELKGCGVLSEVSIDCPQLTSLDASFCSQLEDDCLSATTASCPFIEKLILMSCPLIGSNGLSSLCLLKNLTYLDLSYTFLIDLEAVFSSCSQLTVLKLQACKYLNDSSLEALHKNDVLPVLRELDLSYGTLCQSAIEELLADCTHLTHVSLNGCINMHDLNWGLTNLSTSPASGISSNQLMTDSIDLPHHLLENLNCVGCPNIRRVYIPSAAQCVTLVSLNLSLSVNLKEVDIACSNLCFLNLSNCAVLEYLKLECPKLTSLFLQSCNVDEESVESAISGCSMLETLDVRFCPKISSSSMTRLRALNPSLKRIFCSRAL